MIILPFRYAAAQFQNRSSLKQAPACFILALPIRSAIRFSSPAHQFPISLCALITAVAAPVISGNAADRLLPVRLQDGDHHLQNRAPLVQTAAGVVPAFWLRFQKLVPARRECVRGPRAFLCRQAV